MTELFASFSAQPLDRFGIETRYAHLDNTSFRLHGDYEIDAAEQESDGKHPIPIAITYGYSRDHRPDLLATNQLDEIKLGLLEMLAIYKEQSTSVERGFRFLKDPLFFAHSLFLKKLARIKALLMVMGISWLIYALAEHQIRHELAQRDETIPDQTGKPIQRPITLNAV